MSLNLTVTLVSFFATISFMSCIFEPSSYPYAEKYECNCNEKEMIERINHFKLVNPEFDISTLTNLKDGRRSVNDHWYHVYFYYKKENVILKTWLRSSKSGITFAFTGVNDGLELGNWKEINKDLSKEENALQKKKFKELIFDTLCE